MQSAWDEYSDQSDMEENTNNKYNENNVVVEAKKNLFFRKYAQSGLEAEKLYNIFDECNYDDVKIKEEINKEINIKNKKNYIILEKPKFDTYSNSENTKNNYNYYKKNKKYDYKSNALNNKKKYSYHYYKNYSNKKDYYYENNERYNEYTTEKYKVNYFEKQSYPSIRDTPIPLAKTNISTNTCSNIETFTEVNTEKPSNEGEVHCNKSTFNKESKNFLNGEESDNIETKTKTSDNEGEAVNICNTINNCNNINFNKNYNNQIILIFEHGVTEKSKCDKEEKNENDILKDEIFNKKKCYFIGGPNYLVKKNYSDPSLNNENENKYRYQGLEKHNENSRQRTWDMVAQYYSCFINS